MRAIVYNTYGNPEVLHAADIPKPSPKENEILVKIHASSVSAGAVWMRKGEFPGSWIFTFLLRLMSGFKRPRRTVLGFEFSGEVEAVGKKITRFQPGDRVYGTTTGLKQGAYAEYVCIPEKWKLGVIAQKPEALSPEAAAVLPVGAMTAFHILRKVLVQNGTNVLIYGASGSVGTYAVQIAKFRGAKVTAVCSDENLELVRSIGADEAVDYRTPDFDKLGPQFDVVFDAVGKLPGSKGKSLLKPGGKWLSVKSITSEKTAYLDEIHKMIAAGKLHPVIDQIYPLDDIVEAHHYAETGRKKGNVAIRVSENAE